MPIFGVIENMGSFVCPDCGSEHKIFKTGGGEKLARETGFRFLGGDSLVPRMVVAADEGKPFVLEYPDSPSAQAFEEIVKSLLFQLPHG